MAQTVKLKRTSVAGRIPTTSNIEVGELAFNTNDKALFIRGDSNAIVAIHDESTLHIDTTNNRIGIGSTSPESLLHLKSSSDYDVVFDYTGQEKFKLRHGVSGLYFTGPNTNTLAFGIDQNHDVRVFNTSGSAYATFDGSTSRVGIGTTSPSRKLVISDSGAQMSLMSDTTGSSVLNLGDTADDNAGRIQYNNNTDAMFFRTATVDRVAILSSGNVGIGTNTPDTFLDITGNGIGGIILNQDTGNSSASSRIFFKDGTRTNTILNVSGNLEFRTGATIGASSGTKRLVVKGNGTITFNEAYTFPASDGSANQVLQTDGSGNLSFATVQAGGGGTVSEAFKTIAVSGQDNVVADAATDTLTFAAGTGMTITTNASSDTVTFAASSSDFTDSDGDTKIQVEESSDEDIIRFDTAGTERMTLSSSVLSVKGTSNPEIELVPNGSVGNADFRFDGSSFDIRSNSSSASLLLSTNSTERMRIDNAGRVGIGNTAPGFPLDVQFSGDSGAQIKSTNNHASLNINAHTGYGGYLRFLQAGSNKYWVNADTSGHLLFRPAATGTEANWVVFDEVGRVGIGTNSPASKLEIFNSSVSGNTQLHIHNDKSGDAAVLKLEGKRSSLNDTGQLIFANNSNLVAKIDARSAADDGELRFFTSPSSSGSTLTQRMVIESGGDVGIGETNPVQKLQVNGNIRADGHYYVGGNIVINSSRALQNITTINTSSTIVAGSTIHRGNLTIGSQEIDVASGDFTLDVAGDITLDAGGANINFNDDGTAVGHIEMAGSNLEIKSKVSDKDIIFKGNDGGSAITALTLDMSDAGKATFNHDITLNNKITFSYNDHFLQTGTNSISFKNSVGTSYATLSNTGLSLNGDLSINDNKILKLGNSNDLQLLHDGSHSRIKDTGTGNLILNTQAFRVNGADDSEGMIKANQDGNVELYYNGAKTFETTAPGIQITGTGDSIPTASNASLYLVDNSTLAANTGGSIVFSSAYQGSTIISGGPYIKGYKENATSGDYGYGLKFGVRENGQGATGPVFTLASNGNASFTDSVTVAGDILAKDSNSTTDPSITFVGHTDTGFSISDYGNGTDQINIIRDGGAMALINQAGITSNANLYTSTSGAFRNYGGTWKGTTGTSGNGFQFVNTADSVTAMDLSASGNVVFAGEVEGSSLDINGVADISGNLTVGGNLVVNGTQTILNTATLDVEDKNITLNKGSGDTSGSANGAGITIQDAVDASTDATFIWQTSNDSWNLSHVLNVPRIIQTASNGSDFYALTLTRSGSGTSNPDLMGSNGTLVLGTSSSDERLALTTSGAAVTGNLTTTGDIVATGDITTGAYKISDGSTTTSATTQVTIDSFTSTTFRSCRYTVQVTNNTDSTYHLTELLLVHDGTTPGITEFGTIFTGAAAEATFTADISSGSVRLRATPASTDSMAFKVIRHAITT